MSDDTEFPPPGPPPRRLIVDSDKELARALELIVLIRHTVEHGEPPAVLARHSLELTYVVERLHEWLRDGNSPPKDWPLASSLLLVRTIGTGES
jgi:hypothetical protein